MEDKKIDKIRLKNLIHPIFVKKSKRYREIPPLTKISNAINNINFIPILNIALFKYFIINIE